MSRAISGFYLRAYSKICGFTIVELAVALAVVGVLAVTVTPTYQSSVARSRRAEARVNLQEIASLQGIYVMENDVYATLPKRGHIGGGVYECDDAPGEDNALGFRPEDCRSMRYGYKSDGTPTTFGAIAQASPPMNVYPGCTTKDSLELTHDTEIRVCIDAVKNCPGDGNEGSCTVGCSSSTSYTAWGTCVPNQTPAEVCIPNMVPGTQQRTKTVTHTGTTCPSDTTETETRQCVSSTPGTNNCTTCTSCSPWVDVTPIPPWSTTCNNLGKQTRTVQQTCTLSDGTVCPTRDRPEERDCPCSLCTSWTPGTVDPAAWTPACDSSNLIGTQTQTVTDTCADPGLSSRCTRDGRTETQDCPCNDVTHCCNTSGTSIWRWGGGTCDNRYTLDTATCTCALIPICTAAEEVCSPRATSGALDANEPCRKCSIVNNAKTWNSCTDPVTCPSCTAAEQECRRRDTNGALNANEPCRSCSIVNNTKEWNSCTDPNTCQSCTAAEQVCSPRATDGTPDANSLCRKCSIVNDVKQFNPCTDSVTCPCNCNVNLCDPWDIFNINDDRDVVWDTPLDTAASNACKDDPVFVRGTATVYRTCPPECDPACTHRLQDYGKNVTGGKETSCEDGCSDWGGNPTPSLLEQIKLAFGKENVETQWTVTWDTYNSNTDGPSAANVSHKCAADNPTSGKVTFEGDATRTRTCPTPPGVAPICLESGCKTEETEEVSVEMDCTPVGECCDASGGIVTRNADGSNCDQNNIYTFDADTRTCDSSECNCLADPTNSNPTWVYTDSNDDVIDLWVEADQAAEICTDSTGAFTKTAPTTTYNPINRDCTADETCVACQPPGSEDRCPADVTSEPVSVDGTKPLTTCEDGCGEWGEGVTHNYQGSTWWVTVWNVLKDITTNLLEDSTNNMWQVTWSGGDPTDPTIVETMCDDARAEGQTDPITLTFTGSAKRTRQCPEPQAPDCPLENGCNTQDTERCFNFCDLLFYLQHERTVL